MRRVAPGTTRLPQPFDVERFERLRIGIYDDPEIAVYVNAAHDFAFLNPVAETVYENYQSRAKVLKLQTYRKDTGVYALRYAKLATLLSEVGSVLEVGAGDAGFLEYAHDRHPGLAFACIEPDQGTRPLRDKLEWLTQYDRFTEASASRFDSVCLFHVLEHIIEPKSFLDNCAALLAPGGYLIIEVPSLDDPLLSLYRLAPYEGFFFQKQHPYSYSAASLGRLLEHLGYTVDQLLLHQRYGLENHLNWLRKGEPGGNSTYRRIFADVDDAYRRSLEDSGHADAVISVARPHGV